MDPEHCPLRARHSRASSGLPGHVPAFPELPGMQDQRMRGRSRTGVIPRRLKGGMSELGTGCMSPIAGRAGDFRRVPLSIAWSREDARFFLEAGAGWAFLTRRFSISLVTRVTAAARRLCLALGPPRCGAITPEAGICPRSSRRRNLPKSPARSRAVLRCLARSANALSESAFIAGALAAAIRSRSPFDNSRWS